MRRALLTSLIAVLAINANTAVADAAYRTGRHLVVFDQPSAARSSAALSGIFTRAGVRRAGRGVPELGVATVRGPELALARLRRARGVKSVSAEWARDLRRTPDDPALSTPESEFTNGVPPGTPIQWSLAREGFPAAWDVTTADGAIVGVIDSGVDGANPDIAGKVASADAAGTSDPLSDPDGHGTHVSGIACAGTGNGVGIAGAGWGCRLAVVKVGSDGFGAIRDEDVVEGLRVATERGADAINMSFGGGASNAALREAIDFAVARGVVLVAAASNEDTDDQGSPAADLQPNDAFNLDAGRGLVVGAAEFDDTRAGTGFGPQISLAAYGFFDDGPRGPPGLVSTYPGNPTPRESAQPAPEPPFVAPGCGCRRSFGGDERYAYLAGTSMATPQVAALAAMVSDLNPLLTLNEKLRLLKETARRTGGWSSELGWGIIDAGRAVDVARRIDKSAPSSSARAPRRRRARQETRRARVRVRLRARDAAGAPRLLPSGLAAVELFVKRGRGASRRVRTVGRSRSVLLRMRPGRYRLFTRARDRQGNREARPARADARLLVRRPSRR